MPSLIYFALALLFEIIGYSFHLSVIVLLFKKPKSFNHVFFKILKVVLIIDFLSFILFAIKWRLIVFEPLRSFAIHNKYFDSLCASFIAYTTAAQYVGHLLLSFNRFTLIYFPLQDKSFWRYRWYSYVIIGLPILHICYRLHVPGAFSITSNNMILSGYADKDITKFANITALIFYVSATIISALLNGLSLFKIFLLRTSKHYTLNVNERRLLFISCFIFIVQLLRTTYVASRVMFTFDGEINAAMLAAVPFINDAISWAGSASLLLLSHSIRTEYINYYFNLNTVEVTSVWVSP